MPASRPKITLPCVLVADDSAVARAAIKKKLRAAGFEVIEQASAAPPRTTLSKRLACAILDLDLGDGDGRDVAKALRIARADLPLAFFSASSSKETIDDARTLGPVFSKEEIDAAVAWATKVTIAKP